MTMYKIINGFEFDTEGCLVSRHHFFESLDDAREYAGKIFLENKEIVSIEETDEKFMRYYFDRVGIEY